MGGNIRVLREVAPGKRGFTPASTPPILQRLGLDAPLGVFPVSDFGKRFCTLAGRAERVDAMHSPQTVDAAFTCGVEHESYLV